MRKGAWAESTRRGYINALKPFFVWCEESSPRKCGLPANKQTVKEFLERCIRDEVPMDAAHFLAALRAAHRVKEWADPGREEGIKERAKIIMKNRCLWGMCIYQKTEPLEKEDIKELYSRFGATRDVVIAVVALRFGLRPAEVTKMNMEDVQFAGGGERTVARVVVHRDKVHRARPCIYTMAHDPEGGVDALSIIHEWAEKVKERSGGGALFRSSRSGEAIKPGTVNSIMRRLGQGLSVPKYLSGKAGRVGMASAAMAAGVPKLAIQFLGDWKSEESMMKYLRDSRKSARKLAQIFG